MFDHLCVVLYFHKELFFPPNCWIPSPDILAHTCLNLLLFTAHTQIAGKSTFIPVK